MRLIKNALFALLLSLPACHHVSQYRMITAFPNGPYCLFCGAERNIGKVDSQGFPGLCPGVPGGDDKLYYVFVKEPFRRLQREGSYRTHDEAVKACRRWFDSRDKKHSQESFELANK